jgi:cellulose synthase/poly-beta-1,6-N-acetylglucosamine synthase-like glycosyltransferase
MAMRDPFLSVPRPTLLIALLCSWGGAMAAFCFQLSGTHWRDQVVIWGLWPFFLLLGLRDCWYFIFALRVRRERQLTAAMPAALPRVAVLYTTCNDLCEEALRSCIGLQYPEFHVYVLDDSTSDDLMLRVDDFSRSYPDKITVVRRADRTGFKAGNLNHALKGPARGEEVFALADADEVLPPDFLTRTVPRLLASPRCGFVQANHRVKTWNTTLFQQDLGPGVDLHWRWHQPVSNRHGFVMLLGHGAVIRRACWEAINGFPEIVSEDLGFAVLARERGWRGYFAEDVVCHEEFPGSLRAFRVRHMKWVRGNCEFVARFGRMLLVSRTITLSEKVDVLAPMLGAQLLMPMLLAAIVWFFLTAQHGWNLAAQPRLWFSPGVGSGTILTMAVILICIGPILSHLVEYSGRPRFLLKQLALSTFAYGGIAPLTAIGLLGFLCTRRADFLVTGAHTTSPSAREADRRVGLVNWLHTTHPDARWTQGIEALLGASLTIAASGLRSATLLSLGVGATVQSILHLWPWRMRRGHGLVYLPFMLWSIGLLWFFAATLKEPFERLLSLAN